VNAYTTFVFDECHANVNREPVTHGNDVLLFFLTMFSLHIIRCTEFNN